MRRAWLLVVLVVLGFVARAVVYTAHLTPHDPSFEVRWYEWIYYPTWSRLDGLLAGIALAAAHVFRPRLRTLLDAYGDRLFALAVLLWIVCSRFCESPESLVASLVVFPAIAFVYAVLVAAAISTSCVLARHRSRVTELLAKWSYALYLSHKACFHVVQHALAKRIDPNGNAMFVCCMIASLCVACALHIAVERPFLRWRDRVLQSHGKTR
jgi:peptidoglycan/LPS O-acetylase OafA/YrhL